MVVWSFSRRLLRNIVENIVECVVFLVCWTIRRKFVVLTICRVAIGPEVKETGRGGWVCDSDALLIPRTRLVQALLAGLDGSNLCGYHT